MKPRSSQSGWSWWENPSGKPPSNVECLLVWMWFLSAIFSTLYRAGELEPIRDFRVEVPNLTEWTFKELKTFSKARTLLQVGKIMPRQEHQLKLHKYKMVGRGRGFEICWLVNLLGKDRSSAAFLDPTFPWCSNCWPQNAKSVKVGRSEDALKKKKNGVKQSTESFLCACCTRQRHELKRRIQDACEVKSLIPVSTLHLPALKLARDGFPAEPKSF